MEANDRVLVAILKDVRDFAIARDQHWYRIPIDQVEKPQIARCWQPDWLAFFQPEVFGDEAFQVQYYAKVLAVSVAYRWQLFPNEPLNAKTDNRYFRVEIGPLQCLPTPITSQQWIAFIATTGAKFRQAATIDDLYNDSPLEDRLWRELNRWGIQAQRQEFVTVETHQYALDFSIYCQRGKINVETDGDTWHANPQQAEKDRLRDNALTTEGWRVLRFGTQEVREQAGEYCVKTIAKNIEQLGGMQPPTRQAPPPQSPDNRATLK